MKKAAILAAALAMVLTFAACGNRDNNDPNDRPDDNTVTDNNGVNGSNDRNDPITGNGSTNGNGSSTGRDPVTGSNGGSLNGDNGIIGQDDRDDRDGLDNAGVASESLVQPHEFFLSSTLLEVSTCHRPQLSISHIVGRVSVL